MFEYKEGDVVEILKDFTRPSIDNAEVLKGKYTIVSVVGVWVKLEGIGYPVHRENLFAITEGALVCH